MSFERIINKKQTLAIVFLTGLIVLVPTTVLAQQQTGQVAPQTRNPQTNAPELFQQRDNLQPTGSQNLLQQRSPRIHIPQGVPAQADSQPNDETLTLQQLALIILSLISLLASFLLFKKSRKVETSVKAPVSTPEIIDQPMPIVSPTATKKKSKKKKTKGKPRPKKK